MNYGRILGAGLFGGLVLNIAEYLLHGVVLREDWEAASEALGIAPMSGSDIGVMVVMTFFLGIALVWLYAMIRPRFGPGVKTALVAGFFAWLLLSFIPFIWNSLVPVWPSRLMTIGLVFGFFSLPIAAVAGAWLYKETPPGAGV